MIFPYGTLAFAVVSAALSVTESVNQELALLISLISAVASLVGVIHNVRSRPEPPAPRRKVRRRE